MISAARFLASWTSAGALSGEQADWLRLMNACAEPNPFYAPDMLLAAETHLHAGKPIRCIAIRDAVNDNRLCGLLPLDRPRIADGILGLAWAMYRNPYSCLTTPLIEHGLEQPVLAAAFDLLLRSPGPRALVLPQLVENGAIATGLRTLAGDTQRPILSIDRQPRALIQSALSPEAYRRAHWSKARRSKMRRKLDALKALGDVHFFHVNGSSPEGLAMNKAFLALESSGWKGQHGTALASKPETHAFALQAMSGHSARPDIIFEVLTLNAQIIAMNVNLIAGDTGFTVKTAYDEAYARYSPGLLLDGEALTLACDGGVLKKLDSCAAPGHPLEDIWCERRDISYLILGLAPGGSLAKLGLLARWIRFTREMLAKRHPNAYTTRRIKG